MRSFFLFIFCIVLPSIIYAQDPCATKEFPYRYTKGDGNGNCIQETHCTNDPTATHPIFGKTIRWPIGSNIEFALMTIPSDGCFIPDPEAVRSCIRDAVAQWGAICPPGKLNIYESSLGECVEIRYASQGDQFLENTILEITPGQAIIPYDCDDGTIYCYYGGARGQILLNRTPEFLEANQPMLPCPPTDPACTTTKNKSSLCGTITHEIGHMLGMVHNQYDNGPCPGTGTNTSSIDVMFPFAGINICRNSKLSFLDRCMFQKMYCKGHILGIGEIISKSILAFTLYPNPSGNNVTVAFQNESAKVCVVEFINLLGNVVKTVSIQNRFGFVEESVSTLDIESGTYYVRLETSSEKNTHTLQVIR